MLTLEDCIALSELTEEEIDAIAEHEHLPEIIAAELGNYLIHCDDGTVRIRHMIRDDIDAARAHGDLAHAAKLKLVLRHFIETHADTHRKPGAGRASAGGHPSPRPNTEANMSLKTIRLELARTTDHPEGDPRHGYEFSAPLDAEGHIDAAAWREQRKFCTVRRFTPTGDDEFGHLVHGPGRRWSFHYDIATEPAEDEPGYRFESHAFKTGEYVSITEQDGVTRTFKVVSVR